MQLEIGGFSFELTYTTKEAKNKCNYNWHDLYKNDKGKDLWDIKEQIIYPIKRILPNAFVHKDGSFIEISTGKETDFNTFLSKLDRIEKIIDENGLKASSLNSVEYQGGCHINLDLCELKTKYGITKYDEFLNNYYNLMCSYPASIWAFLSPNDMNQATVTLKNGRSKGFCKFTQIQNDDYLLGENPRHRMEMRFFMMPRTRKEFIVHYDYAVTIFNYVLNKTLKGKKITYTRKKGLKLYTYNDCVNDLKQFCQIIDFDYQRIVGVGKLDILEQRFSYINYKDTLI